MRIVVLGAGGFIGRVVTERLCTAGMSVLPLLSTAVDLTRPPAVAQLSDILIPTDSTVVLSAITRDKSRDGRTFIKNVVMAQHIAEAVAGRCSHVVYVSSDAVYGEEPPLPVTERTPVAPTDLYGLAHMVRERLLTAACMAAGTPIAVLRPTTLYGPGDTHRSYGPNRFLRTILENRTITLFGNGEETRDYLDVDMAGFCQLGRPLPTSPL